MSFLLPTFQRLYKYKFPRETVSYIYIYIYDISSRNCVVYIYISSRNCITYTYIRKIEMIVTSQILRIKGHRQPNLTLAQFASQIHRRKRSEPSSAIKLKHSVGRRRIMNLIKGEGAGSARAFTAFKNFTTPIDLYTTGEQARLYSSSNSSELFRRALFQPLFVIQRRAGSCPVFKFKIQ